MKQLWNLLIIKTLDGCLIREDVEEVYGTAEEVARYILGLRANAEAKAEKEEGLYTCFDPGSNSVDYLIRAFEFEGSLSTMSPYDDFDIYYIAKPSKPTVVL